MNGISFDADSVTWRLPPCLHVAIAACISSPVDLHYYVCRACVTHHCASPDWEGMVGSALLYFVPFSLLLCVALHSNEVRWSWIRSVRHELGIRVQRSIQLALHHMRVDFTQELLVKWNELST